MKKLKLLFLAIATMIAGYGLTAQSGVSISEDGSTTDGSAMLDVKSTSKGFLPPRMTTVERDAISSLAEGLVIYNTDSKTLQVFDGTLWSSPNAEFACGYQILDADSNSYNTIRIGTQC